MNPNSIKRRLDQKVINRLGIETTYYRYNDPSVTKDAYGEPANPSPTPLSFPITIVIDTDKRHEDESDAGGMANQKNEFIYFYCSGSIDIRIGDKVLYPAGSTTQWLVNFVVPNMINNVVVITEVKAFRDART